MSTQKRSLLNRLRMAVQKVKLLISSTILSRTWEAANMFRSTASLSRRHLSFHDERPGLLSCSEETDSEGSVSTTPSRSLQRTISCPSSDDDIDKRAEMFIANFRRQLQLERQISLQLRYRREPSFELISPWICSAFWFRFWVWFLIDDNGDFVFFMERISIIMRSTSCCTVRGYKSEVNMKFWLIFVCRRCDLHWYLVVM